ncbi:hypothetical protein AUC47_10215 [Microbacterium sp. SZ1]|nr:hypothetical protein AUC47_10215 [Microbacterium sp. SZ1]
MRRLVADFPVTSEQDRAVQEDFASFFSRDDGPVQRGDGPRHATASAFVFDPTLSRVLLVFHGKGRFWVQPGGHLEPEDHSVADAALRELSEETGIVAPPPGDEYVYDLDHHELSAAFGRCASHLDVGVALIVAGEGGLRLSDESEDVRWWPIDALPDEVPPQFHRRVAHVLTLLRR